MTDICIIGAGKVGGTLAVALSRTRYQVAELITHSNGVERKLSRMLPAGYESISIEKLRKINSEVIFITTQDPHIAAVADHIAPFVRKGQYVFHASGSLSSEVLKNLRSKGCHVGSLHPLTSISDPIRGADQFAGTYFCVEGTQKAIALGRRLVRSIGGHPFTIETKMKPLYHAAAVTSAGHITALFDSAVEMLSNCGVKRNEAQKIFLPLLKSTAENLGHNTPEKALTGSFARMDFDTVKEHIRLLDRHVSNELVEIYKVLGSRSIDLVERRSGRNAETRRLRRLISVAKQKSR